MPQDACVPIKGTCVAYSKLRDHILYNMHNVTLDLSYKSNHSMMQDTLNSSFNSGLSASNLDKLMTEWRTHLVLTMNFTSNNLA